LIGDIQILKKKIVLLEEKSSVMTDMLDVLIKHSHTHGNEEFHIEKALQDVRVDIQSVSMEKPKRTLKTTMSSMLPSMRNPKASFHQELHEESVSQNKIEKVIKVFLVVYMTGLTGV
jgi:hypothetical protein